MGTKAEAAHWRGLPAAGIGDFRARNRADPERIGAIGFSFPIMPCI